MTTRAGDGRSAGAEPAGRCRASSTRSRNRCSTAPKTGFPPTASPPPGGPAAKAEERRGGDAADAAPVAETDIAEIRKEGLTGRQLRMARRLAQKHGLPATSDYDAVRLLRSAGIDPFHRANMLELVSADGKTLPSPGQGRPTGRRRPGAGQLPQTVPAEAHRNCPRPGCSTPPSGRAR